MKNRKIIGLMACDPQGLIGKNGALPWSYPEELAYFRHTTYQQIMIMGRKTFEAMPEAILKDRFSIVFSTKKKPIAARDNLVFVSRLEDYFALTGVPLQKDIYLIGGAQIAELFLSAGLISEFFLTLIHKVYEGDTYFSRDLLKDWSQTLVRREKDFSIYRYARPILL